MKRNGGECEAHTNTICEKKLTMKKETEVIVLKFMS